MKSVLRKRLKSFGFAFNGIRELLRSQPNARIHLGFTLVVATAGFYLGLSRSEWSLVVIAMMLVWLAEAMNTALEFLADAAAPEQHPLVAKAKDVAAGSVLIAAVGAVIIGLLVLGPHVLAMLEKVP